MKDAPLLIYVIVFGIVFIPYAFISFFMNKTTPRKENTKVRNLPPVFRFIWGPLSYFSESMDKISKFVAPEKIKSIENYLLIANIKMSANQVIGAACLLAIGFSTLVILVLLCFTTNGIILLISGIIAMLIGAFYPFTTIQDLALKRQQMITRSLPFAIDLIASAMRSGVDFIAAIRYYVSTENEKNPLAVEFGMMLRQLELGKTRIQAIEDMSKRIQTDGFSSFTAAVAHGFEVGASIVETMKLQGTEMRRIRFNIAERKAARAASAMIFPIAVFIMPAMFLIIGTPILIQVFGSGLGGLMK